MPYIRFNRLATLVATGIATALITSGCHNGSGTSPVGMATTPTGSMTDVVATVNSNNLTTGQLYDSMLHYIPAQLPGFPQNPMVQEPASHVALQFLIENNVVTQLAKDKGVPVTQDQIDARYNDLKMIEESHVAKTFEAGLAEQGFTPDSFKAEVITPEVAKYNLLTAGVTATDSELQAYYTHNLQDYQTQSRVHLERVSFADQATANAAYTSAVTTGSLSAYAASGSQGDIDIPNWIGIDKPDNHIPPSLLAQLRTSKPGDVLKPVQMGQWTVIRVVDKKPAVTQKFDDVKHLVTSQMIEKTAEQQGKANDLQSDIANAIRTDTIETKLPEFKPVVDEIKAQSKRASGGNGNGVVSMPAPGAAPH